MFKHSEIRKWSNSHGYTYEKHDGSYLWFNKKDPSINGESKDLGQLVTDIYNQITNGVWVSYQQEYAAEKAAKAIHLEPPR